MKGGQALDATLCGNGGVRICDTQAVDVEIDDLGEGASPLISSVSEAVAAGRPGLGDTGLMTLPADNGLGDTGGKELGRPHPLGFVCRKESERPHLLGFVRGKEVL